jgi:hypothetical protein
MGFQIIDGRGSGKRAGIDSDNRLLTQSINETIFQHAAEEGDAFFIGTPLINLTNSAASAVIIIENNEEEPLILGNFFLIAESTTGGSPNMFRVTWYKNPTSISGGTTTSGLNQNFGSSKTLDATIQYGAQGSAVTGGTVAAQLSFPIGEVNDIPANLVLPKGSSFALTVAPPAGNTSMNVQFGTRAIKYIQTY